MRLKNGEFQFEFSGLGKNRGVDGLQTENKMKKKKKKKLLEALSYWFEVLRQLRGPRVHFLALGDDI